MMMCSGAGVSGPKLLIGHDSAMMMMYKGQKMSRKEFHDKPNPQIACLAKNFGKDILEAFECPHHKG